MKQVVLLPVFIFTLTPIFSATYSNLRLCQHHFLNEIDPQSTGKEVWSKNVWSTIGADQLINSVVFLPLNEHIAGYNYPEEQMDLGLFETGKSEISWNLWTILKYYLLKGDLTFYAPWNPVWIDTRDNGFLIYPTTSVNYGSSPNGTYFSDPLFATAVKDFGYLGEYDYSSPLEPIMSINYPDEDSITNGNVQYYPRYFAWYRDKDILRYRLREKWIINSNGEVQDKIIEAIAPVVNRLDYVTGEIIGQKELFWIDFSELKPFLDGYYVLLDRYRTERVISYGDYFEGREYYASVEKSEEVPIKKEE